MTIPTVPSKKSLSKLTKAQIEERLKVYDLEWQTLRDWSAEDAEYDDDPFLTKPTNAPTHAELEHALNVSSLHRAPIQKWIESLTVSQIQKVCKEYKVEFKTWFRRTASLTDMRRQLGYRLPEVP